MKPHNYAVWCVALALVTPLAAKALENEKRITIAAITNYGGSGITILDLDSMRVHTAIETGAKPHGIAVAPDGKFLFVSNEGDNSLAQVNISTRHIDRRLSLGRSPHQLAISDDGTKIYVAINGEDAVAIVDVAKWKIDKIVPVGKAPHIPVLSSDGKKLFVTSEKEMKISLIDATTFAPDGEIPLFAYPRVPAMYGNNLLISIRWLNGALVADLKTKSVVAKIDLGYAGFGVDGKDAHGLAVRPGTDEVWLTSQTANKVFVVSLISMKAERSIDVGKDPNWIAFTSDGSLSVVSNTKSGNVTIIRTNSGAIAATLPCGKDPKRLAVGEVFVGFPSSGFVKD